MKKILSNKKTVVIFFSVVIMLSIILIALEKNFLQYFSIGNYPEPNKICQQKKMIWDKEIYLINTNPAGGKLVLKVENRNKDAWSTSLLPIQSPTEEFKICTKGILKFSKEMENSPNTPSEIKKRSKGLELSIGIQEPFKYTPFANLTFSMRLFASRFHNESYNLEAAVANIAENILLIKESDTRWRLSFNKLLEDEDLPFHYDLVLVNDQEIMPNSNLEFISKDNGKTWSPMH